MVYKTLCECDISSKLKRPLLGEYLAMSILFWPDSPEGGLWTLRFYMSVILEVVFEMPR